MRKITKKQVKEEKYGQKIFDLVNRTYNSLFDFTVLPDDVIDNYVNTFLGLLDLKFVTLSNGNISNVTGRHLRRVDIPVSVAYGSDAEVVKKALLAMVEANPLFLNSATKGAADPFVGLTELADSSVNFVVRAWVKSTDYWDARFQLQETIYTELPAKYGIGFPFPQMDVHVHKN